MKLRKFASRPLYGILALCGSAVLLAVDQIIKYFVLLRLKPVGSVTVIGGLLELSYLENRGAAFGMFQNQMWFVVVVTVVAFAAISWLLFCYKSHTVFSFAAALLLIAGGAGNLLDRILYGFVVDFIHVLFFGYIFNFADCCITVGGFLFAVHVLLTAYWEKQEEKAKAAASPEPEGEE